MAKKVFITGASGFLGRNLVEALAKENEDDFYFLVRSEKTRDVLKGQFAYIHPSKIHILPGDVTSKGVVEDIHSFSPALRKIDEIWHMAASTSFDDRKRDEIVLTNLEGTRNMVALAEKCHNLDGFHYISTGFIAGVTDNKIMEDELPKRNGFRNSYESSKYDSESLVRASGLPFTIFRPSIIVGNSKTGDSQGERRMMYGYVLGVYYAILKELGGHNEFMANWENGSKKQVNTRLIGHYPVTKNLVCIDDIVDTIMDITKREHTNKTFNLTNNRDITGHDIKQMLENVLKINGISYNGNEIPNPNRTEKSAMKYLEAFMPYTINPDPKWDTTNTDAYLKTHKRIDMTPELLNFLMEEFVKREIVGKYK